MEMTADEKRLWLENKKLAREVKRLNQDIALLRVANEQAMHTQAYIQRGNDRQLFYIDQLMKSAPNILIMTDGQLRTVMTSEMFFRYNDTYDKSAIRRGVPLHSAVADMLSEAELSDFMEKCRAVLAGEYVKSYLLRGTMPGNRRHWRVTLRRMSMDGEVVGLTILFADTTEMVEALERAESADKAKSAFLANMSHEIRTPINAMLGLNEMILRESGERETLGYATDIHAAGKTLLALVNEILDFSKVEQGQMEILPTHYELGSVLNDLENMTRGRAEEKGLSFHVEVDESTPGILFGDEIRIRQCVLNILTNAVKYTQKGSVTLTVGYEKIGEDRINLRFSVSDTGIGMRREDMDRLYTPFSRIEESRNRSIEGTGLGMTITRRLLELMGSQLEVQSVYGEGSTFAFSVEQPVVRWTPVGEYVGRLKTDSAQRPVYRESFRAPDARVLVVDDMPANLTVVKGLLKRTQVLVETALSGKEALAKASLQHYDVIFVDHMMPEMDGIETLRELKKLPQAEHTVFIALTANALSGSREIYLNAGFSDYLAKPVDGSKLEEILAEHLPSEKLCAAPASDAAESDVPSVLVVACDEQVCRLATHLLENDFHVETCRNGGDAPALAASLRPDMVLLDVTLGEMSGFEVLRAFRRTAATHDIPVVFMMDEENSETETLGIRNGASDFIRKAFLEDALLRRTRRVIELSRLQTGLQNDVKHQIQRTERLGREMMMVLSKVVDAKDRYTKDHSRRVATYAAEIARRMGKTPQEQKRIYEMGLLHDVGKIGLSEELLNKTEHLTDEEFRQIKMHTVTGCDILRSIKEIPELALAARSHHERYDGKGYPDGLRGGEIPEVARILCVADCYDAMTSTRAYAQPREQAKVRAEIERCSGTQFDPAIASVMLRMIDEDAEYCMNERSANDSIWKGGRQTLEADAGEFLPEPPVNAKKYPLEEVPEVLRRLDEINAAQGLRFCGSAETYLETATIYAKNLAAITNELEQLWHAGDVAGVTVKVHALKSTSRTVGAEAIGALSERLEAAGRAGDTQTIDAELGGLLARVRSLGEQLAPLLEPDAVAEADLPPISREKLQESYKALRGFAEEFDTEGALFVLSLLDGYFLDPEERARCQRLREAVDNFSWEDIESLLG